MSLDTSRDIHDKLKKHKINHILLASLPNGQIEVSFNIDDITEYDQYIVYLRGIAADMEEEIKEFEKFIRAEMKKEERKNKQKDSL